VATFAASLGVLVFVLVHGPTEQSQPVATGGDEGSTVSSHDQDVGAPLDLPSIAPARVESAPPQPDDPALRSAIEEALDGQVDHFGVVVRRLRDGRGVAINPDREFYAASLYKLAVLYEAERRQAAGELDFSDLLQLTEADLAEDLGTIDEVPVGPDGTLPIRAALGAMVTLSDNATAVALLHLLGGANIDATLQALGLQHTSVNTEDLPTTAADMATLMQAIVTGRGLNEASLAEARAFLLGQLTRSGIPSTLPDDVAVGDKTGTWTGATHDLAFVDAPNGTYVIAVLSDGDWDWAPIGRVSRAVYDVLAAG
jgi:beta-lactamase class A